MNDVPTEGRLDEGPTEEKFECVTFPEALDEIFDRSSLVEMSENFRLKVKNSVRRIDESDEDNLTCIATDDLPELTDKIISGIVSGQINDEWDHIFRDGMKESIHGMSKRCVECTRDDCESRTLNAEQFEKLIKAGAPISSRSFKGKLPVFNEDEFAYGT